MSWAGSYTLHLYCDNATPGDWRDGVHGFDEFPWEYNGDTLGECRTQARNQGWLISSKRQLCPKCSGKRDDD